MRTTQETINEMYESIHTGDFERLYKALSPECVIEYYGPSVIPFAGIFRGIEKCKLFFNHVAEDVEILNFSQLEFIVQGDGAAVCGNLKLKLKSNSRVYESDYAHILNVSDGKIIRFRDFQNTALAAAVCTDLSTPIR